MKSFLLFPHTWRLAGCIMLLGGIGIAAYNYFHFGAISADSRIDGNFFSASLSDKINTMLNDAEYCLLVIGLLLVGFSKEKVEDEQIAKMRLESLQWSVYFNYGLLIICIILINGVNFLAIMAYNVMSQLVFFVIRFRWKVYRSNRLANRFDESSLNHVRI